MFILNTAEVKENNLPSLRYNSILKCIKQLGFEYFFFHFFLLDIFEIYFCMLRWFPSCLVACSPLSVGGKFDGIMMEISGHSNLTYVQPVFPWKLIQLTFLPSEIISNHYLTQLMDLVEFCSKNSSGRLQPLAAKYASVGTPWHALPGRFSHLSKIITLKSFNPPKFLIPQNFRVHKFVTPHKFLPPQISNNKNVDPLKMLTP